MAWQWSNLEAVLDPWVDSQSDTAKTSLVLEAMAQMATSPNAVDDTGVPNRPALVRQRAVPGTTVILVYLRAQQFNTFRLLQIADLDS